MTNGVPESQASQDSAPATEEDMKETKEPAKMEETNAKESASNDETGDLGPENHSTVLESSNATGVEETPTESF